MKRAWIEDWTGKVMFDGKEFASFDDAEAFLSEYLGDHYDIDREEYEVCVTDIDEETTMKTQELELPEFWAAYLINGDASGLEADELAEIEACLARQEVGSCLNCSEEPFFSHSHDARNEGVLPATCLTYTFEIK